MPRVSFFIRDVKDEANVHVRLRLRDGRSVQLFHKTDIVASLEDLNRLAPDGKPLKGVKKVNTDLSEALDKEFQLMLSAYSQMKDKSMVISSSVLEEMIERFRVNPFATSDAVVKKLATEIVPRFQAYLGDALRDGIICQKRHDHIMVVCDKLERFLIINGIAKTRVDQFDCDMLMRFKSFIADEYTYVDKYPLLYARMNGHNRPKTRLSMNTVASQMKMLKCFLGELENRGEILKSPFNMLTKERKKTVLKTMYDEPYFLRKEELLSIMSKDVPACLQPVKDAFLLQCAFGCRVGDFQKMSMEAIAVSEEGIPYVHYIPHKTVGNQSTNVEIQTPVVKFAFDIIKRTEFNLPILRNVFGKSGYNVLIKSLLRTCRIDRKVAIYNEETQTNEFVPICDLGSSKLARRTHVDLMTKVQVNMYAAGLHKVGSSAVKHYTALELIDRFALMNAAFGQKPYKVTKSLKVK